MNLGGHDIGVCSWSLRAKDTPTLIALVKQLGLEHVQLALTPLVGLDDKGKSLELERLRNSGLKLVSGMVNFRGEDYSSIAGIGRTGGIVPDDTWETRRPIIERAAALAAELNIRRVSCHLGFIPAATNGRYPAIIKRVADVAETYRTHGVELLLETGQENAASLRRFLEDLAGRGAAAAVNFDPANMILYGAGDCIEAVRTLGQYIGQVHIKDAIASEQPGTLWGAEVPFGAGQVRAGQFLAALKDVGFNGPLVIEREAGDQRMGDIQLAIATMRQALT